MNALEFLLITVSKGERNRARLPKRWAKTCEIDPSDRPARVMSRSPVYLDCVEILCCREKKENYSCPDWTLDYGCGNPAMRNFQKDLAIADAGAPQRECAPRQASNPFLLQRKKLLKSIYDWPTIRKLVE